jgi:hypothetical protein
VSGHAIACLNSIRGKKPRNPGSPWGSRWGRDSRRRGGGGGERRRGGGGGRRNELIGFFDLHISLTEKVAEAQSFGLGLWPVQCRYSRLSMSLYHSPIVHHTLMRIPETEQQQSPIADPIAGSADADRGRLAKACSACSRQKVRCDGAQPCTRCCSVGLTDQCIYLPSMRGKIKRRKTKPSKDASCEPSHRMQTTQAGTNNSALWDTNASTSGSVREAEPLSAAETSPTASLARGQTAATLDKLTTTLPQNGDAHNPLSVLVELSEAASSRHSYESPTSTFQASASKRQREEDDYYAPLERTLKEEAPHIMALINTHESAGKEARYVRADTQSEAAVRCVLYPSTSVSAYVGQGAIGSRCSCETQQLSVQCE